MEQVVVNNEGKYENFTGKIDYKGNKGDVQNATFELKGEMIIWLDGIWHKGTWKKGIWHGGTWRSGFWEEGIWKRGIWKKGLWRNGTWEDDTWKEVFGIKECGE